MDQQIIYTVVKEVVHQLSKENYDNPTIPIGVSARHCHLSKQSLEKLFGVGYELTKMKDLKQPGQFAANETVTIIGPKRSIHNVRILGPVRDLTQVEISKTDAIHLGLNPPIRQSGKIEGSSAITIVGPKGIIFINEGLIIAEPHIHMHPDDANIFKVKDGEYVRVFVPGERPITFEKVLVRVSKDYTLEMHIDTDEANAASVTPNSMGILYKYVGGK